MRLNLAPGGTQQPLLNTCRHCSQEEEEEERERERNKESEERGRIKWTTSCGV
jgi:hypothetical protein